MVLVEAWIMKSINLLVIAIKIFVPGSKLIAENIQDGMINLVGPVRIWLFLSNPPKR
jgi:hypothetical protein